jgi:hypothetical protein
VIRCWYANEDQEELFSGCESDAKAYLAAHWDDPDPREPAALPIIKHASAIEQSIVVMLVNDLLAAGLTISVWNGGDEAEIEDSNNAEAIFAELAASDQDELCMRDASGCYAGWIRLVWGNDASVISDYTTRLEEILNGAKKLADELEG